MNKTKIKNSIFRIISSTLKINVNQISLQKTADDFTEWDSLSNVRLILNLEKFFKVKINISEVYQLNNINDLVNLIIKKVEK